MRRVGVVVLVLGAIVAGVYVVARLLESDEERIRSLLADMTDDFNEGRMLTFVECFADDYRDASHGFNRDELQSYLFLLARRARNANGFIFRAEIVDPIEITIDEEHESATARFSARIIDTTRPQPESSNPAGEVTVRLEKRDGWQVSRTDFSRVRGRLRF